MARGLVFAPVRALGFFILTAGPKPVIAHLVYGGENRRGIDYDESPDVWTAQSRCARDFCQTPSISKPLSGGIGR